MSTSLKTCFKCSTQKSLDEFYRHPMMKDGRLNKCMECTKSDVRTNRRARIGHYRQYDRIRGNRQSLEYRRMYRIKSAEKYQAHYAVTNAVRDGRLEKPEVCSKCLMPNEYIHGHHADYSRPLDVAWLCPACHAAEHH